MRHLIGKRNQTVLLVLGAFIGLPAMLGADGGCTLTPQLPNTPATPGDSFANAGLLTLDSNGSVTISGTITGNSIDFYDLGAVSPGDRVIVTVEAASGSTLDPTIAVFDGNQELFSLNDDIDFGAGNFNSALDDVVVVAGSQLFLAVTKFAFDPTGGAYEGTVRIERGGAVPQPAVQMLLLNFNGGAFTIEGEGSFNLDPFDAADIDAAYAGETTAIKNRIAEVVRENFENTGLMVVTTDENANPTGVFSTIHFGAFSTTKFGVADSVDQGNADRCDDGIVFTNSFDDPFAQQPSVVGIATAIANVAAHEAGHLLGLNHVGDITAVMDNTGTASTLLADQDFKTAELSPSIFPVGMQNAQSLLDRVVPVP